MLLITDKGAVGAAGPEGAFDAITSTAASSSRFDSMHHLHLLCFLHGSEPLLIAKFFLRQVLGASVTESIRIMVIKMVLTHFFTSHYLFDVLSIQTTLHHSENNFDSIIINDSLLYNYY